MDTMNPEKSEMMNKLPNSDYFHVDTNYLLLDLITITLRMLNLIYVHRFCRVAVDLWDQSSARGENVEHGSFTSERRNQLTLFDLNKLLILVFDFSLRILPSHQRMDGIRHFVLFWVTEVFLGYFCL